jgi:5-deoxy-glucuronate isomerase
MERHFKWQPQGKFTEIVEAGTMRFLGFGRLLLSKGEQYSDETGDREWVMDVFSGSCMLKIERSSEAPLEFREVGSRASVFYGPPAMVYLPISCRYTVTATSDNFDAGLYSAPAERTCAPVLMVGPNVITQEVGANNWKRTVHTALGENVPAERLLAGETLIPSGNWASYPPHKHDRKNPPNEAVLEEVYFFRVRPSHGYGFIWTYTAPDDRDGFSTVFVVEDGDTILLPKGYHPVVAAPGYELHYAWVLAGEERRYGAWTEDPRHAWVKTTT